MKLRLVLLPLFGVGVPSDGISRLRRSRRGPALELSLAELRGSPHLASEAERVRFDLFVLREVASRHAAR